MEIKISDTWWKEDNVDKWKSRYEKLLWFMLIIVFGNSIAGVWSGNLGVLWINVIPGLLFYLAISSKNKVDAKKIKEEYKNKDKEKDI